jgi:hypothetical protein
MNFYWSKQRFHSFITARKYHVTLFRLPSTHPLWDRLALFERPLTQPSKKHATRCLPNVYLVIILERIIEFGNICNWNDSKMVTNLMMKCGIESELGATWYLRQIVSMISPLPWKPVCLISTFCNRFNKDNS